MVFGDGKVRELEYIDIDPNALSPAWIRSWLCRFFFGPE
jgi:hypothetical protein